jgi:hypothetical protein
VHGGFPGGEIGCGNLQVKQGRGDDYIPISLTSSNNG